ncbi:hypothetical protein B0H15DRAFT_847580 [Mycena belliarum]|uniref:Zn(2)-C6 fungal-type domain-containing protein n=1 Tax=Mycena belliarum TaxID=1033014 RepID=A0AAD6TZH7_9AGAR|nr:hypothetical protein B0H15DRAFT_847580 [Mycena belliae]
MDKAGKPSTCGRCRTKKIRCDGRDPCGPCSKARADVTCSYTAPPPSHGPELRKGAACSACRRKKKKCSGDWPCRTCIVSKKEDDCKYDDGSQLSFTRALIERTLELEQLLSEAKQAPPGVPVYSVGPDLSAELDQLLSTNLPPVPEPVIFDMLSPNGSDSSRPTSIRREEKPFNYLETFNTPTQMTPPSPAIPIVESTSDKLFRLRKLFLAKRLQFGFVLSAAKLSAITNGDLSGNIVHPVMVHVAHLWGYMFDYYERNGTWTYAPDKNGDEVAQMRLILGALAGMLGPAPDPVASLITYLSVALYFFHKADFSRGQEFLSVASNTAMTHDLDLAALANVPHNDGPKGLYSMHPISDADELRSAYSHLIYCGVSAQVVLSAPPALDARLLEQFDLLMDSKITSSVDINFLKAKSVRLLIQTRQLNAAWNNVDSPPPSWFEQYWKLIEFLHAHIAFLNTVQLRVSFIPDAHTTHLGLKLCSTMSLTALADLHGIFSPSHAESSRRYRDAVVEIVSISSTFSVDDCQYLDPILPLCWSVATKRILDNQVVYENQDSIITAIRECNSNLQQVMPYVIDFETSTNSMVVD